MPAMTLSPTAAQHPRRSKPPMTASAIYYLGPRGTYSHQVAMALRLRLRLPPSTALIPCPSISHVYQIATTAAANASSNEALPLALLPFENSTFGPVRETWSLLSSNRSQLHIVAEHSLSVAHALLVGEETMEELWRRWEKSEGKKRDVGNEEARLEALGGIERVVSHEQALGQCRRFLSTYLPNASIEPVTSTAEGATLAASSSSLLAQGLPFSDPTPRLTAAIGSEICADPQAGIELKAMLLLAQRSIQDRDDNTTRFILVRPGRVTPGAADGPFSDFVSSKTANGHGSPQPALRHQARSILLHSYTPLTEPYGVGTSKGVHQLLSDATLLSMGLGVELIASRNIVTSASVPVGPSAGEVRGPGDEAVQVAEARTDLVELSVSCTAEALSASQLEDALTKAIKRLEAGKADERFHLLGVWSI